MSDLRNALHSHLRVQALADVSHRYGSVITGLTSAIDDVLDEDLPDDARARLREAISDAEAQLSAISDVLDKGLEDLPEGRGGG